MSEELRQVTQREVFDEVIVPKWKVCFEKAQQLTKDVTCYYSDIIAIANTLFKAWDEVKVEELKKKRQKKVDKENKDVVVEEKESVF